MLSLTELLGAGGFGKSRDETNIPKAQRGNRQKVTMFNKQFGFLTERTTMFASCFLTSSFSLILSQTVQIFT